MKVNLECGNDIRSGYLNISSWPNISNPDNLPDNTRFAAGRIDNLNPILEDNSVEEIIFAQPVNLINPAEIVQTIDHWKSKLVEKGILKLSFIDIKRVARSIHLEELDLEEIDQLLFGPHHAFKSIIELSVLITVLKHLGFSVKFANLNGFFGTIEATKDSNETKN